MKVIITRDMVVPNERGDAMLHFQKYTRERPFEDVSEPVFEILTRAGAAALFVEGYAAATAEEEL
jgi:hypothetical protein